MIKPGDIVRDVAIVAMQYLQERFPRCERAEVLFSPVPDLPELRLGSNTGLLFLNSKGVRECCKFAFHRFGNGRPSLR